ATTIWRTWLPLNWWLATFCLAWRSRSFKRREDGDGDPEGAMKLEGAGSGVTGGASGIGRGTALAMARQGADIVLADVNDRRLADVSDEIAALGQQVLAVHCDVSLDDDVERLAEDAEARLGPVGLVMNN